MTVVSGTIDGWTASAARRPCALDPDVIERAKEGDPAACRVLVATYQRSVHSLLWRMLGTKARRPLVEDLTQDAFFRAFRSLPRFQVQGPAKLSTWLLTIAARTAIDELRRPRLQLTAFAPVPDETARPDAAAERRSTGRAIAGAVDRLAPALRATFILRAYHDLSYPEIAGALEVDIGTVKSRLHRARQALKRALEEVHRVR